MDRDDGWTTADVPDLSGRRALVTGATSGLGAALVHALAAHGAQVVAAGRDEGRLTTALGEVRSRVPGADVAPLLLDLADQSSVRRAATEASAGAPLDLLVCNAGVMGTPYTRTVDGFELQLATNVLGHFALTGLLTPRLLEAGTPGQPSRVVNVSSQAHRGARSAPLDDPRAPERRYRRWQTYGRTKLANLLLTFELDRRARAARLPLTALAAHPGFAATGIGGVRHQGMSRGSILDAAFAVLGQPVEQAVLPLLMAATADLPGSTYVGPGGPGEVRGAPQIVGTSALARDPEVARRMWEVAQDATGVVYP